MPRDCSCLTPSFLPAKKKKEKRKNKKPKNNWFICGIKNYRELPECSVINIFIL